MPCYYPLRGYRSLHPNANGKFSIHSIKARSRQEPAPPGTAAVDLPCGQCIGCRLERSRKWAVRCMNEASLYSDNCFITLTYRDEFLPANGSLDKDAFQLFMKRLRKKFGSGPRYFQCGEYGEKFSRPHYHACLFNFDFPDKVPYKELPNGSFLYTSAVLASLWPFGFSTVGAVTFDSAAYVARYCLKKVTGDKAVPHYTRLDAETGELYELYPEFVRMSRRPGIGSKWYEKFSRDVYPSDFLISRGFKMKPPRYYDGLYEFQDKLSMEAIRERRAIKGYDARYDNTLDRLKVREKVAHAKLSNLKRSFENAS